MNINGNSIIRNYFINNPTHFKRSFLCCAKFISEVFSEQKKKKINLRARKLLNNNIMPSILTLICWFRIHLLHVYYSSKTPHRLMPIKGYSICEIENKSNAYYTRFTIYIICVLSRKPRNKWQVNQTRYTQKPRRATFVVHKSNQTTSWRGVWIGIC